VSDALYLDDLSVGQRFETASHRVTREEVVEFAGRWDPQPFHLDEEAGAASLFGSLVASGWHTAAITMRLNVDGGIPFAGGLIGVECQVSWPRPTRPGDMLRVVNEVLEVRPSRSRPDRGMVTVRGETLNQDGEVVQSLVATMVVPRRPAPQA